MLKMTHPCRKMRFLTTTVVFITIPAVCLQLGSAKGNSVEELREPSGEFQSPGFPDLDDDMRCEWKIVLPRNYRIMITFLDFELVTRAICNDEVEIYDGNTKRGTYRGTALHQRTIASTSNIMTVVLTSCGTSLFSDRRGIRASYSSVYPTTPSYETSKKVITTRRQTAKAVTTESTLKRTFSSQSKTISSNEFTFVSTYLTSLDPFIEVSVSDNNSQQVSNEGPRNLVLALLAGILGSILILIIIAIAIAKRRKAKYVSNATTTSIRDSEVTNEQADFLTVVAERTGEEDFNLEYDYVQGAEIQNTTNENVCLDKNGAKFSTKMSAPRLQKKHPVFNTSNDLCEYENNATNIYDNTDFDEDYSTASCTIQQASPRVHTTDTQMQLKDSDINLDEGLVTNTVYEPYH